MPSIQEGILAISHEPANHPIVKRFLRFAAAVALVPIFVYFVVSQAARIVTTERTGLFSPPILGGLAAVLSLNIVMGMFAILALKERVLSQPAALMSSDVDEEDDDGNINQDTAHDHAKTE